MAIIWNFKIWTNRQNHKIGFKDYIPENITFHKDLTWLTKNIISLLINFKKLFFYKSEKLSEFFFLNIFLNKNRLMFLWKNLQPNIYWKKIKLDSS